MEPTYTDVLFQWLFLFALIGIFIVPAVMLRRAALKANKIGWHYFLIGLVLGIACFSVGQFLINTLQTIVDGSQITPYVGMLCLLVPSYLLVFAGVSVIKRKTL